MKFELCNGFQEFLNDSMSKGCSISRMLLVSRTSDEYLKNKGEQEISYICISEDNPLFLSFVDQSKYDKIMDECPDKLWAGGASSLRYHSKPSKAIRRILDCDALSDSDFETFSNMLKSANASESSDWRFTKVGTDKIDKYYEESSYGRCNNGSSLGGSCMRGDDCVIENYFEIYKNESKIKLLVLLKTDDDGVERVYGRALLWNGVTMKSQLEATTTINFMDRIYTADEEKYKQFFIDYAVRNGYWRKYRQNYTNLVDVVSPHNRNYYGVELSFILETSLEDYDAFPYLDTFRYGNGNADILKNKYDESFTWTSHGFSSTGGGCDSYNTMLCDFTDKYYESVHQTYDGKHVSENLSIEIRMADSSGSYLVTHAYCDDENVVKSNYAWGRTRNVLKSDCMNHKEYGWVPTSCLVECNDGTMELKANTKICGIDGGYIITKTSAYITSLDIWVHQDRVAEALESAQTQTQTQD